MEGNFLFNNNIDNLKDRKDYVEEQLKGVELNTKVSKPLASKLEKATRYINSSKDIESGRKVDYPYYRSDSELRDANITTKANNRFNSLVTDDTILRKTNYTEEHCVIEDDTYLKDEYINKLYRHKDIKVSEIKRTIKYGMPNIKAIKNENLYDMIVYVYIMVMNACSDTDKIFIELLSQGMEDSEIAERLGITRQAVHNRIMRIIRRSIS